MGYVFESETIHPRTWGFSTWSRKVSPLAPLEIKKHGIEQDKANLPQETYYKQQAQQVSSADTHASNRLEVPIE
jgi:hypothetical protein